MLLAVRISSYGCTWEVWRALKKLELLRFFRALQTRYTHAKHEPILNKHTEKKLKNIDLPKNVCVIGRQRSQPSTNER